MIKLFLIVLYFAIGFLLFGMAENTYSHDMSEITWFVVMILFTSFWPFWLAYGIGNSIRFKLSKGNKDESSESTNQKMGV